MLLLLGCRNEGTLIHISLLSPMIGATRLVYDVKRGQKRSAGKTLFRKYSEASTLLREFHYTLYKTSDRYHSTYTFISDRNGQESGLWPRE